MERVKKAVSLVLCFVMVLGFLPMNGFAASSDSKTEYLMLGSDRHGNTSVIGQLLTKMGSIIGTDAKMDYVGLLGDMVDNTNSYDTATILSEVQSGASYMTSDNVDVLYAAHDKGTVTDANSMLNKTSGQWYSGTNYYVYGVVQDDMDTNYVSASAAFVSWANSLPDDGKVIVVISHMPIHAYRGDNTGGGYWHNALNTVATGSASGDTIERDVIFFHGHNHTEDGTEYYYAAGSTMSIENYVDPSGVATVADNSVQVYDSEIEAYATSNGTSATIYYTYATAGYMLTSSGRGGNGHATLLAIGEDTISLARVDYDTGLVTSTTEYAYDTDGYAVFNRVADSSASTDSTTATTATTPQETEGTNSSTSTTSGTVYVLTDTLTTGKNYLIVDANAVGTGNALVNSSGGVGNTTVTIKSGELTIDGTTATKTYIELSDNTAVWTAGTSSSSSDVTCFSNNAYNSTTYYLYHDGGALSLNTSTSKNNWTYASNVIKYTGGGTTYYLNYSDGWNVSSSATSANVYIYEETTVETAVTLSSIAVTNAPTKTAYTVGEEFSSDGLVVTATYSDGSTKAVTGYTLSGYDMNTAGEQTVSVSYTEGDVTKTATFTITVSESLSADAAVTSIQVSGAKTNYSLGESFTTDGMVVTATYNDNGTTKTAVVTDYTVSEVDMTTEGTKAVTVSYTYNGTTVTTTFDITVTEASSNEVTLGSSTTTTTTKTVYVLVDAPENGEEYLIVSNGYALVNNSGSATGVAVTDNGSITINGTTYTGYIELDNSNAVWTAATGWTFKNGSYYLGYSSSNSGGGSGGSSNYSVALSSTSRSWTYNSSDDYLYVTTTSNSGGSGGGSGSSSTNRYIYYTGSSWSLSTSTSSGGSGSSSTSRKVLFYKEVTYTESTTVDTTVTYTMRAENLKQVVVEGNEDTLSAELDYCLQGNGADLTTLPSDGSYSFTVLSDANDIIDDNITDGTVTFTGNTGTAKVKVAYTWTVDGKSYTVYKNITVEATDPYYTLDLHHAVYTFTQANITEFASGVTYYVQNEDGTYSVTTDTEYVSGTTYYTATVTVGDEITETVAIKGVEEGKTYSAWAVIKYYDGIVDDNGEDGENQGDVDDNDIEWTSSDETIATVDAATGIITFTGKEGSVQITATYKKGNKPSDTINISVTASQYSVPSDGTNDFPEYPNEGAIRYDKTATAVGNFSETGIAQVELSMTGVPYTTGSEIDVVVMLDMSTSMDDTRIAATVAATKVFLESIVKNEDGSYNNNRVYVGYFNGDTVYTITDSGNIGGELASVDSDTEYNALISDIEKEYDGALTGTGTNYDVSLEECYNVLTAAKKDGIGNNRAQFCVFMSDGGPTDYATSSSTTVSESTVVGWFNVSGSSSASWTNSMVAEYWSTQMKANGVSIYSVGLILQTKPTTGPSAYTGLGSNDIHYYITSTLLTGISSGADYFFNCEDSTDTEEMEDIFSNIAMSILQAATDITVEDQITDEYTMIFDIPKGDMEISGLDSQEFYIEFVKYTLDENHERTSTVTSVTKLYLGVSNGSYYAASDSTGTAYVSPVFDQTTVGDKGTLYYWTTDQTYSAKAAVSYSDGTTTYYFVPYGKEASADGSAPTGWYNMTSGAYASGTIDEETNMSTNLVIATPYFVYNAATKMLYWTVDKLDTYEYALRYFLYLNNSATEVGTDDEVDAKTYPTNNHAYITYTNFRGNDCRQVFPIPQLTWNGAQVSYVFYLVNSAGQPINKSGQVVDFANAVFVTDVYTKAVVWNKGSDGQIDGSSNLSIDWLAANLLPEEYMIYDENAGYELHVFADASGESIFNYFIIEGSEAADISASLNERLDLDTTASTVSKATTKVYNTKAGSKYTDYGVYTSKATDDYDGETVLSGFDFANTTVAFAVVWESKLVEDVVVVDYGLDVLINVVQNDLLQNTVSGIGLGNAAYGNIPMNTGVIGTPQLGTAALSIDGNTVSIENENQVRFHQGDMEFKDAVTFYYESPVKFYENSNQKEGYMYSSVTVIPATTIYYEDNFVTLKSYTWNYDEADEAAQNWTESTKLNSESAAEGSQLTWLGHQWTTEGTTYTGSAALQDTDRPGDMSLFGNDANNLYGYDSHYTNCSQFSMGSAAKINVDYDNYGEMSFTFAGTGFDVISMTSNKTGTIFVTVYDSNNEVATYGTDSKKCQFVVDTYYGYARKYVQNVYTYTNGAWVVVTSDVTELGASGVAPENPTEGDTYTTYTTEWYTVTDNDPNALYQVPVIKVEDLTYGTYKVVIEAMYDEAFDHNQYSDDSFDFYLDAIRIYDPANDGASNSTISNAYKADGEYLPEYYELRNWLISAKTFNALGTNTEIEGVAFIGATSDGTTSGVGSIISVDDYNNYGPNNELYLAPGQAVAFKLNAGAVLPGTGYVVESVQIGLKSVGDVAAVKIWDAASNTATTADEMKIETATDLYYDISAMDGKTVVILNSGSELTANADGETTDSSDAHAILSITNVKVTYKEDASEESGTDTQSIQNELQTASFSTIGTVQTYAVAATAETETTSEETSTAAPFTVSVAAVEMAIATMSVVEEDVPEVSEPETSEPETSEPETSEPETSEPETSESETSEPETSEPETSEPETSEPETSEPETSEPETSEPETSEPETSEPETSEPETSEPETSEPDETEPEGDSDDGSALSRLIGWIIGLIGRIFG